MREGNRAVEKSGSSRGTFPFGAGRVDEFDLGALYRKGAAVSTTFYPKEKACDGKMWYPNEYKATLAAASMMLKYPGHFHSYPCPYCKGWHVGHTPKEVLKCLFHA